MRYVKYMEKIWTVCFYLHDLASELLIRHMRSIKCGLLITAHVSFLALFLPALAVFRGTFGSLAGNLLIGILFLSPLATILRMRLLVLLMGMRRELGILMGYLACVHGFGYLLDSRFTQRVFFDISFSSVRSIPWGIFAGCVGLIMIVSLLSTSNTISIKILGGKRWKQLHRLVYPAFIIIIIHRFFQVSGEESLLFPWLESSVLVGSYAWLKYLAWRPTTCPPLRVWIGRVRSGYQEYHKQLHSSQS